jgi:hypothetical protein
MLHLKLIQLSGRLVKFISILMIFPAFSFQTYAQQPDTVPVKKTNILNRIITSRKDTIKPKQPTDVRKIPDDIVVQLRYPDTLTIGAYTLIAEAYDKGGNWNANAGKWQQLNGTGRIKFNCPGSFTRFPGLWKDAEIKPVRYKVVSNLKLITASDEIRAKDADELGLNARTGDEVELDMPHYNGKAISISRYITDIKTPKKAEGLLVRFTDISVSVIKAGASRGNVIAGIAQYPTTPADPAVPFTLSLATGFQLEVSTITFSPGLDPLVNARLILPSSLTQNSECARGHLNLGEFRLAPNCEFYKEYPGAGYGIFGVGNTTLAIGGNGYVVDFSSSQSYPTSGKPANWKGVVLMQGSSDGTPADVVSNIGYIQARYTFSNGIVESTGLTANFNLASPYSFTTTQPFGYTIYFTTATINIESSKITTGFLRDGTVKLPLTAVQLGNGNPVVIPELSLTVKPSLDLTGMALIDETATIYWGDLVAAGGGNRKSFGASGFTRLVRIFFAAEPRPVFNPVSADGKSFRYPLTHMSPYIIDSLNMQGATLGMFKYLVVNTKDRPGGYADDPNFAFATATSNKVYYRLQFPGKEEPWINVVTEGIHCHIKANIFEPSDPKLGDNDKDDNPLYVGGTPFSIKTTNGDENSSILLQCVESAVLSCSYNSFIQLSYPITTVMGCKDMVFTSTANNAGGDVVPDTYELNYWGLNIVPRPGFSSSGVVSVKTGQIILNAAGISEYRHFAQPFWVTWGEILAKGTIGRLFFDYNTAGQQFDKFNYAHNAVSLSEYVSGTSGKGFLRVGGTAFFPFFGGNYLHIKDQFDESKPDFPHNKRVITLSSETVTSYLPTDSTIYGNWNDRTAVFDFIIRYADGTQDGFTGSGTSAISYLSGDGMSSTIEMNSRGTCIRIGSDLLDQRSVSLGPVANVSNITRIWGCVCIKGDAVENIVVGGELTNSVGVSVAIRAATYSSAILQITPSLTRFTVDGEVTISVMAGLDAMVNGHMQLTLNHGAGFVEGEVMGKIRVAGGAVIMSSSIEAEGQMNWHLGNDFNELQGMVAVRVMGYGGLPGLGVGAGTGVGAGFYLGVNAPKSRAWVLIGSNPRYSLNTDPLPSTLTGVYGFVSLSQSISIVIISGGYELYVGFGAFLTPGPTVAGNLGGRIHGEILGGLVSAAAYFNLQVILGTSGFGFQGTVGLEACVLWVICGSIDITVGLNSAEGFYIR